ncbi:MAG: 50S ribosomal protein L29 [Chloroflexi bacterium RBG_16_48_8]|nr:MAG: 50S ribosomal protein L29 [Chloroflexi bacterium RBG_16_48_8]
MKLEEMRALSPQEIRSRLEDAREEYFRLRFQFSGGQLTDTSRLRVARREIARLATILQEVELEVEYEGGGE